MPKRTNLDAPAFPQPYPPQAFQKAMAFVDGTSLFYRLQSERIVSGARLSPGDVILGLRSSGIHCNGLTLARMAFGITFDVANEQKRRILNQHIKGIGSRLGDELLTPSRIYVRPVLELLASSVDVRGLAHITSDGFLNLPRLEADVGYFIDELPEPQAIFGEIQQRGHVSDEEMYEVFNMGIGFCVIVPEHEAGEALDIMRRHDLDCSRIGYIVDDPSRAVTLVRPGLRGWRSKGFEPHNTSIASPKL